MILFLGQHEAVDTKQIGTVIYSSDLDGHKSNGSGNKGSKGLCVVWVWMCWFINEEIAVLPVQRIWDHSQQPSMLRHDLKQPVSLDLTWPIAL